MSNCAACGEPVQGGARFCPSCGAAVDPVDNPTYTAPRRSPSPRPSSRHTPASGARALTPPGATGDTRFVPGTLIADRYRVVGLVGRGGMGEVYRADDLLVGQPVALKFLPEAVQDDSERLARLYSEVRVARQVSHAAVCRVYDVGEMDGRPFLSMEYVDGEDLASLQRRIGRLPSEKALDVARQVCAGLAAAHEKGVLHRDLKPENVMLDGRGRVRITDFGLAGLAKAIRGDDVRSGTPAYMSPEQFAGREVSARSDIYALGLVLYELFTGRKAFEGRTYSELERKHREEEPPRPTAVVESVEPAVERTILRCLEKDPQRRPASALAVAAALPGGDPLAEALAAGETPSPEMVAAARAEGLPRPVAWGLALATLAGGLLVPVLARPVTLFGLMPFDKAPDALEDRAQELLRRLGHAAAPADDARGYSIDGAYLQWVSEGDRSPDRWEGLRRGQPPVVQFWYRRSPRFMLSNATLGRVYSQNPPLVDSGMAGARFDPRGRLVQFYGVPAQREPAAAAGPEPDWSVLFTEAQLDAAQFRRVAPEWTPPFFADNRAAWEGVLPDRPEIPIRVEAAGYRGQPVWFQIVGAWTRAERMEPWRYTPRQWTAAIILITLLVVLVAASGWLAHRNLARGRGDRAGAWRLAVYAMAVGLLGWSLWAHHVADLAGELTLITRADGVLLLIAFCIWMLYLAVEPYVRRRSPHLLISWTRLLAGRGRDAAVGRDVLVGAAAGALMSVAVVLSWRLPGWLGQSPPWPQDLHLDTFLGVRERMMTALFAQLDAAAVGLGMVVLLVLFRMLVRSEAAAVVGVLLLVALPEALGSDVPVGTALPASLAVMALPVFVMFRFGLLAVIVTLYTSGRLLTSPFSLQFDHWTGAPTAFSLAVVAVLLAWGLVASASRRRLAVVHDLAA
jgi:eukaryotic-like serine/threonine-protein kinase